MKLSWSVSLISFLTNHFTLERKPFTFGILDLTLRYKKCLRKMFKSQEKGVVFFERNFRTQHLQIQVKEQNSFCLMIPHETIKIEDPFYVYTSRSFLSSLSKCKRWMLELDPIRSCFNIPNRLVRVRFFFLMESRETFVLISEVWAFKNLIWKQDGIYEGRRILCIGFQNITSAYVQILWKSCIVRSMQCSFLLFKWFMSAPNL